MNQNILESLQEGIKNAIIKEVGDEFERTKREMIERLNKKKQETIARIAIDLCKQVDFQQAGDVLTIRIKSENI